MKNFEKKLAFKLKEEAERITPELQKSNINMCGYTNEETQHENQNTKKNKAFTKRRIAVIAATLVILFSSIVAIDYISEMNGRNYSFQIISFAGNEQIDQNQIEEKLLEANISMVMPHGQITLNPELTVNPKPWEWAYGWGTGSFYVAGEDIARVTYSLKNGIINHYDMAMEKKKELEGNPVRIEFFLPYTVFQLDESQIGEYELEEKYTAKLKELWNSGKSPELEAAKSSYFAGKSFNIEDYTIMNFVGTWKAAQTDGRYFRFRDISLDEELNREGHELTVEYYHFDYGDNMAYSDSIYSVLWSPKFEPGTLIDIKNPEDLPADEMTVTIELQNGEKIKKNILLSFDEEGYAVARVK